MLQCGCASLASAGALLKGCDETLDAPADDGLHHPKRRQRRENRSREDDRVEGWASLPGTHQRQDDQTAGERTCRGRQQNDAQCREATAWKWRWRVGRSHESDQGKHTRQTPIGAGRRAPYGTGRTSWPTHSASKRSLLERSQSAETQSAGTQSAGTQSAGTQSAGTQSVGNKEVTSPETKKATPDGVALS